MGSRGLRITGNSSLVQILLTPVLTNKYREQKKLEDGVTRKKIMHGLFECGIFLNPISTKMYLSLQHTKGHIAELGDRLRNTLRTL